MCAPVSVTISSGVGVASVIPQIIGMICLAIGAVWAFVTGRTKSTA